MRSSCAGPRARTGHRVRTRDDESRRVGTRVVVQAAAPGRSTVAVRCMKKNFGGVFCYISHQILAKHSWCPSLP